MKSDLKKHLNIFIIIIASISFLACMLYLEKIFSILKVILTAFSPFFIGLGIAFVLNLPLVFFEKKLFRKFNHPKYKLWNKIKRAVCLILSIVLILGILTLVFSFIIPAFVEAAQNFIINLPDRMEALKTMLTNFASDHGFEIDLNSIVINWDSISTFLIEKIEQNQTNITVGTFDALVKVFKGLFNFVLGVAFSIYILASKETLSKLCKRFIFAIMKRTKAEKFLSVVAMSSKVFAGFVSGQCIEVVIIGCLCFIGMAIFKMPYAPMISCLIAITAFIPVFGAFIGTAFGALIIFLENPLQAVWFVIFIIVLQQIESNAIYPRIMGKSVGLPGLWVLLAVTVGGTLFGVWGMIISVPTVSVLYCLFEAWLNKRLNNRKICTHTFVPTEENSATPSEQEAEQNTVTIKTRIKEAIIKHEKHKTENKRQSNKKNND